MGRAWRSGGVCILALFGRTIAEHLSLYADADHPLGHAGQIAFALIPTVQVRRRWREGLP